MQPTAETLSDRAMNICLGQSLSHGDHRTRSARLHYASRKLPGYSAWLSVAAVHQQHISLRDHNGD